MGATSGIQAMGTYTGVPATTAIANFLALIPDPDTRESPSPRNFGTMLDEMSPGAAAQLRVEVAALTAALDAGGDAVAYGTHTVTAAQATANQADIVTGLADTALGSFSATVWRAGALISDDGAVLSEPAAGTIRVADGGTYDMTAGDVIVWFAIDPSA